MYQKNRGFPGFLLTLAAGPGLHCHSHSIEGRQGPGQVIACVSHATADSQPPRGHPDMKFRHTLAASVALIPVALPSTPAFAQSTGSVDFENDIVVTGSRTTDVAGHHPPDTSTGKSGLGQGVIADRKGTGRN